MRIAYPTLKRRAIINHPSGMERREAARNHEPPHQYTIIAVLHLKAELKSLMQTLCQLVEKRGFPRFETESCRNHPDRREKHHPLCALAASTLWPETFIEGKIGQTPADGRHSITDRRRAVGGKGIRFQLPVFSGAAWRTFLLTPLRLTALL